MKTLYLDLASGISGDMFLGALLDLGVEFAEVQAALAGLGVGGYRLHAAKATKAGIQGTRFHVHLEDERSPAEAAGGAAGHSHDSDHAPHDHPHHHHHHEGAHDHSHAAARNFADIRQLIERSKLDPWVKERAVGVFGRLAQAEGRVHGRSPEEVHFHEVGAVDSIVDIVGGCVALDLLGRPRVRASVVTEGSGFVDCAHGRLAVPAPATLELLAARKAPLQQCQEPHELVTPTGAALLAEFAETFGPMPSGRPERIGYGLGSRENRTRPNVLRAVLLEERPAGEGSETGSWETDEVAVLETNLDDTTPELLGDFMERALAAGALDVFHTPVQMKKNRPGVLLTVICAVDRRELFAEKVLTETSAFGVRWTTARRNKLRRTFRTVETRFGEVTVKEGWLGGRRVQATPEYEACRELAERVGVPLAAVYAAACNAAGDDDRQPSSASPGDGSGAESGESECGAG